MRTAEISRPASTRMSWTHAEQNSRSAWCRPVAKGLAGSSLSQLGYLHSAVPCMLERYLQRPDRNIEVADIDPSCLSHSHYIFLWLQARFLGLSLCTYSYKIPIKLNSKKSLDQWFLFQILLYFYFNLIFLLPLNTNGFLSRQWECFPQGFHSAGKTFPRLTSGSLEKGERAGRSGGKWVHSRASWARCYFLSSWASPQLHEPTERKR